MVLKLASIIEKETGKTPNATNLAKFSELAVSTTNDALNREVNRTSFGIVVKILQAANISVETVAELYTSDDITPTQVEKTFLSQTDLKNRIIMGVEFSTPENFWKARDVILDTIYEGIYPSKDSVHRLMERIEHRRTSEGLILELRETYAKESL